MISRAERWVRWLHMPLPFRFWRLNIHKVRRLDADHYREDLIRKLNGILWWIGFPIVNLVLLPEFEYTRWHLLISSFLQDNSI